MELNQYRQVVDQTAKQIYATSYLNEKFEKFTDSELEELTSIAVFRLMQKFDIDGDEIITDIMHVCNNISDNDILLMELEERPKWGHHA